MKLVYTLFALFPMFAAAEGVINIGAANLEADLNTAVENMNGATTIVLPAGRFEFSNELIIDRPGLVLKGQGQNKTVLSFAKQKAGPQGIIATKDQITFEDFAVEDSFGNAIKVIGAKHVTFRRVKVSWTRGKSEKNGAYGLYPVLSEHVLIENCDVSGASDAGIYVGQSKNIIVRNNYAHDNVAGIEIENSDDADVYENLVERNTAGVLIFNLPDLVKKDGIGTRIYRNNIRENNTKNFSMKGTIINLVPKGMGVFMMAAQGTEVFDNDIAWHALAGVAISNYAISQRTVRDPQYDPMPKRIYVHGNRFKTRRFALPDGSEMNLIIKVLSGLGPKDVVFDGIDDGTYVGTPPSSENRICIGQNTSNRGFKFANLHLDNQRPYFPFPGGPVTRSLKDHECAYPSRAAVTFPTVTALPIATVPSEDEVLGACKAQTSSVNWKALDFDCPDLADFNLFADAQDPTQNPQGGTKYSLNNQLFTDYALKDRFIFIPPGTSIGYREKYALDLPIGSVITKTFSINEPGQTAPTLIETRLLVRRSTGWVPLNYTWANGRAKLDRAGFVKKKVVQVKEEKIAIDYHVPNLRQCSSCHFVNNQIVPIGLQAQFLNRPSLDDEKINQLEVWNSKKIIAGLPAQGNIPRLVSWDDLTAPVDERAKAYLEINCAHCHNAKGNARSTGLYLQSKFASDSVEMGHCKTPVAAGIGTGGHQFDVVPGKASKSILFHRMGQSHLAVKMPQLGRSVSHKEGNALIETWINEMPAVDCAK